MAIGFRKTRKEKPKLPMEGGSLESAKDLFKKRGGKITKLFITSDSEVNQKATNENFN